MKKGLLLFLICTLILIFLPTTKSYANDFNIDYLDIRLTKPLVQTNFINMQSDSGFSLYDKNDKGTVLSILDEKIITAILNENGDINLINSQSNIIITLPKDGSILISSNEVKNPTIKIEKDRYRDYIRLINKNNVIIVINHVKTENYLYGVVPKEMSPSFHVEALKAQAVAARSFAYSNISKHSADGFDLCDTIDCQVYSGYEVEKPSTNLAVDETKDILAFYDGKIIDALYHSTSSGFTEDSRNVWGGDLPYLKSVEDNFSSESPYSSWNLSISFSDLSKRLSASGINLGEIKGIEALSTTSTGKVEKVKIIGIMGEQTIDATQFRSILGTTTLKSAWFSIKDGNNNKSNNQVYVIDGNMLRAEIINLNKAYILDGKSKKTVTRGTVNRAIGKDRLESLGEFYPISTSEIVIEGKGYGHGVGMSQYGAKKMAELGYGFEEILKYYYTGIDVLNKNQ